MTKRINSRQTRAGLWQGVILCLCLFCLAGCATLPGREEISEREQERLIREFREVIARQQSCHCCIDAQATVSFSSIWQKGKLSGYLQAMAPSSLKFLAVNPLGQTMVIFVTDGDFFRYVPVFEAKQYEGKVTGTTYAKYAPAGFLPEHGFYWLIGRLYPGRITILDVTLDGQKQGYWFEISYGNGTRSLVLFDEQQRVLLRHIVMNDKGEKIFNVLYDEYTEAACPLPGKVTVTALVHNSTLEIRLADWLDVPSFSRDDFSYDAPPSFDRVMVQ
ncbi:MAG: hypothetical protein KKA54_18355 [Proteobacteria bacterium]|nr:hypothetical protein [Pseudomonadota bacterium]MBU0968329.1 hypothetical protein [Pseudomonadota bacterium]